MRKIKLEMESLAVESFSTSSFGEERGTVLGRNAAPETGEFCASVELCGTFDSCGIARTCTTEPDPSWIDACPSERTCPTACSFTECSFTEC